MTRIERLLATVADRPEGEKVNIPALIRAFTPTQAETIAAIEYLITQGKLDALTLRRPKPGTGAESQTDRKCLTIETPAEASPEAEPTEPPGPGVAAEGGGDARKVAPPPNPWPSGAELVERLQAHIDLHRLSKTAVCKRLFSNAGGMSTLKWMRRPKPKTVAKIEAFLALPPADDLRPKNAPLGDRRYAANRQNTKGAPRKARKAPSVPESTGAEAEDHGSGEPSATRIEDRAPVEEPAPIVAPSARARPQPAKVDIKVNVRRDPTQPPATPMIDFAEHERIKAARLAQSYKKRVRTRAKNLIAAGETTGRRRPNVEVSGAMRELRENADAQARFDDPIEQAKLIIRAARWNCFDAPVNGGPADHYYIGNRVVDEAELLAFAERLRTTRARRTG